MGSIAAHRRAAHVAALALFLLAACTGAPVTSPADGASETAIPAPADAEWDPGPQRVATVGEWVLDALDPGGRVLQVTALYGGCEQHHGLGIEEDADAVLLTNRLSQPAPADGAMGCPAIARSERIVIVLDAPLGDRALRGCGAGDCRDLERRDEWWGAGAGSVVVDDDGVVVDYGGHLAGLTPDGALRWRRVLEEEELPALGGGLVDAGDLVLRQGAGGQVEAVGRQDGSVRWSAPLQQLDYGGWSSGVHVVEAGGDRLVVGPRPEVIPVTDPTATHGLGAVALDDGTTVWEHAIPEGRLIGVLVAGDTVVAVSVLDRPDPPTGTNRSAAATTVVTGLGIVDGRPRWSMRLAGAPRSAAVAQGVVVMQVWAGRYGIDPRSGAERWRDLPVENAVLTAYADVVFATEEGRRDAVVIDPATGATSPAAVAPGFGRRIIGDLLVEVDGGGVATATDVLTGDQRWAAPLMARAGPPAGGAGLIVFPTPLGAVALDAGDGSLRWSWADEALEGPRR